jgi:hypothetical protein
MLVTRVFLTTVNYKPPKGAEAAKFLERRADSLLREPPKKIKYNVVLNFYKKNLLYHR